MAMNERATAQIYLDGRQAEAALDGLKIRAKSLKDAIIEAGKAGDQASMKKFQSELKGVEAAQRSLKKESFEVQKVLNNLSGASTNDLNKAMQRLNAEMRRTSRTDPGYKILQAQAMRLKVELAKVSNEMRVQQSMTARISDGFNKYFGIVTAGAASFAGLIMAGRKAVDTFNQFEERVSNLSALTGLEGEQLEWLTEKAKETSVATVEGNIRIKQSADAIVDAYTKVGSQRPELLKNKEALHAVTQDAIILSEAAKIDLEPAVAGLTMAMNQLGYESDQSRRIINVMAAGSKEGAADIPYLTEAYEKSGTTARLMKIEVEQLTGVIEAVAPSYAQASMAGNSFDKVLLKMKANNIGYVDGQFNLIAAIDELDQRYKNGESSASLFGVEHAKMGELLVLNRDEIIRYTNAVTGTEIALEQAAKNTDNNAARLAQAQNRAALMRIELGEKLSPAMTHVVSTGSMMLKFLSAVIDLFGKYGTQILIVAGAIAVYYTAVKIKANWDGISHKLIIAKNTAEKAYAITTGVLTGKIKLATVAQMIWNKTVLANPILAIVAGLAALAAGTVYLVKKLNEQSASQKILNDVNKAAQKSVIDQKIRVNELLEVARDETRSLQDRKKAIEELNKISPKYFGNLTLETINTKEATQATDDYINSLVEKARVQAAQDKLVELERKKLEDEIDGNQVKVKWHQKLGNAILANGNAGMFAARNAASANKNATKAQKEYNEQVEALKNILKDGQTNESVSAIKTEESFNKETETDNTIVTTSVSNNEAFDPIKVLEKEHQTRILQLKKQRLEEGKTEEWYRAKMQAEEFAYLTKKLETQKSFGLETEKTEEEILDAQLKLHNDYQKNIENINKDLELLKDDVVSTIEFEFDDEGIEEAKKKALDYLEHYDSLKEKYKSDKTLIAEEFMFELSELKSAYEYGIVSHEEYELEKLRITQKHAGLRIEQETKYLEGALRVADSFATMYESQKNAELAKAGENEAAKARINKKYAKKQQGVASAQAGIAGALAIMRIWSGEITKNPVIDAIIKGAMTIAMVATTAAQIKEINAKQFYTGGYTGAGGKFDPKGIVHSDEFVLNSDGTGNPAVRHFSDVFDYYQRTGQIGRISMNDIVSTLPKKQMWTGGYTTTPPPTPGNTNTTNEANNQNTAMMAAMVGLLSELKEKGIRATAEVNAREVIKVNASYEEALRASEY